MNKTEIETLFLKLSSDGYKKPHLRADGFLFKLAPVTGANPGAVYVTRESDGEYLGKIHHGKLKIGTAYRAHEEAIEHVANNPKESALRYGHRSGKCACCGRTLDNKQSIELGIGPICAEKFGWISSLIATDDLDSNLDDIDWSLL